MARCRKEHDFSEWVPTKYFSTYGYVEITEEQLLQEQKEYDEDLKKHEGRSFYIFHRIHWIRKCKKCNKKHESWLNPYDRPKSPKIKVKMKSNPKFEREERHGRKLLGNEKSVSKGWKPW